MNKPAATDHSSRPPLRAAVIGCGWIGCGVADDPLAQGIQAHAAAYAACEQTELTGLCDSELNRARAAALRWGVQRYTDDVGELLAVTRPQVVSVCTPDATHAAVIQQVLASPHVRAVIAEKPLAATVSEAQSLIDLARQRDVVLAVNYVRRYSLAHAQARARLAAGEIGAVLMVQGSYTKGVAHNGTHWFDLARWMIGNIVSVHACPGAPGPTPADPTCHVRMRFDQGASGFLAGLDAANFTVFEMDIIGTRGRLRITDSGMQMQWSAVAPSVHYSGYQVLRPEAAQEGGFRDVALRLVEDVVEAVHTGRRPICSGEDGVAALAVAQAARISLETAAERSVY
jgi:predicted dehydrogenase